LLKERVSDKEKTPIARSFRHDPHSYSSYAVTMSENS